MPKRLEGKTAIIIGAGQTEGDTIGNGRAISVLFAREGAKVFLVDINPKAVEETKAQIDNEGGEAAICEADATNPEDCQRIVDSCLERWKRIDIFVYNIGIGDRQTSLTMPEERWDAVFSVNLKGLFSMYKQVIPVMETQEGGSLINISSVAAVTAMPMLAYKSSKAGMNSMTQSIAVNFAHKGIRANVIMPGLMDTPMAIEGQSRALQMDKQELREKRDARVPLKGGMGTAWDVAYAALFLASDEAKFVSGVMLPVDGAQSARVG